MKAEGQLKRRDDTHVALTSTVVLDDFAYAISRKNVWARNNISLHCRSWPLARPIRSRNADDHRNRREVHLISSGDSLDLVLQKPLDLTKNAADYAATASLKGNLATWQSRLQPVAAIKDWKLAGITDLTTSISATRTNRLDLKPVHSWNHEL